MIDRQANLKSKLRFKKTREILLAVLSLVILLSAFTPFAYAEEDISDFKDEEILKISEEIIEWKKKETDEYLLNNKFLENAGDTSGDWYPIGIGRIGYPDDYHAYLAVIEDKISQRYLKDQKLSKSKATEWHRISLSILSMGGDPRDIGKDENGNSIDLIRDGTFNRGKVASLGGQGINGWIWGLITLDSMRYEIPNDSFYTRDDIILEIIELQIEDGGFSLDGNESDPDITGMAIQALAPYYNSEEEYNYFQNSLDKDVNKKVRDVIDEALGYLSKAQSDSGAFRSWNMENTESAVQVVVALTALGIDPMEDERFIKDGKTLVDAIMSHKMEDGGFIHSKEYDPDNPTAEPDESNSMASEQVLYSLASILRLKENHRSLYDFRLDMDDDTTNLIDSVKASIDNLSEPFKKLEVEKVFSQYMKVPIAERSYVYNYKKLTHVMNSLNIENKSEALAENMGVNSGGNGNITPIFDNSIVFEDNTSFTQEDLQGFNNLPKELTTENYVEVIKLIRKIEIGDNKEEHSDKLEELYSMEDEIIKIQDSIDSINEDIIGKLYPFEDISIKDKKNIDNIIERFNSLSDYDKKKILQYEDVIKSKTKVDNRIRALIISSIIAIIVIILIIIVRKRMKKRRIKKMKDEMLFFDDGEDV